MRDIEHKILSQVHHLLSIATEEELRRVANSPSIPQNLRTALDALAAERASSPRRANTTRQATGGGAPTEFDARKPKGAADGLARELTKAFERLDKNQIQGACRSVGVSVPFKAKDARERVIRRAANLMSRMPNDERDRMVSALRLKAADAQTEGWVGVIRKGQ